MSDNNDSFSEYSNMQNRPVAMPSMNAQPAEPTGYPSDTAEQTEITKSFYVPQKPVEQPVYEEEQPERTETSNGKTYFFIGVFCFIIGLICGSLFLGEEKTTVIEGLQGVVSNPDLARQKLPRCGQVEKGRACVLYILNHSQFDRMAESFFENAVALTEVPKYPIMMANPQYAKKLIRPGYIAEIKVPTTR